MAVTVQESKLDQLRALLGVTVAKICKKGPNINCFDHFEAAKERRTSSLPPPKKSQSGLLGFGP